MSKSKLVALLLKHHQRTQIMQSYCKFLPNFYVLRLIGTVELVGNIIPVFKKLDIDIYARCKLFWGHHQKKHRACYFIVSSYLFLCSVACRNYLFRRKYGHYFWEAAHPHLSSSHCFWGSLVKKHCMSYYCKTFLCVIFVKHVNNVWYTHITLEVGGRRSVLSASSLGRTVERRREAKQIGKRRRVMEALREVKRQNPTVEFPPTLIGDSNHLQ